MPVIGDSSEAWIEIGWYERVNAILVRLPEEGICE